MRNAKNRQFRADRAHVVLAWPLPIRMNNTPPHPAAGLKRKPTQGVMTMSKMTRGEVQDLMNKFATENPKYRQALLTNPKATIERQLNASLGSVTVKALAETA